MSLVWLLVAVNVIGSCSGEAALMRVYSPGDIIIGGLFPVHLKTNRNQKPGELTCTEFDFQRFLHTQVMIHTINQINQRTPRVLPNVTIGYDIYDTCGDVSLAIKATLRLLKSASDPHSCSTHSDFSQPQTKVVIGESSSEVSIAVARIVALAAVAQVCFISYASTSELLSRKFKFPTFLRTVSSDKHQAEGICELVRKLNWKSVAVVGSEDEYGRYGSDLLNDQFFNKGVCVEFVDILPGHFNQNTSDTHTLLADLMGRVANSSAEAIILFTKATNVEIIIEAAIQLKLNRTWIASDSWSTSPKISAMPGIEFAGTVYGFIFKRKEVPGFKKHIVTIFNDTTNNSHHHHHLWYSNLCLNESEDGGSDCWMTNSRKQCLNPRCLIAFIDQDYSYSIYLAVEVIADGLRRLLKCDSLRCERSSDFTPMELLREIWKVNRTFNTTHVVFDENGDPSLAYDIVYWKTFDPKTGPVIETIGEYWPDGRIHVPEKLYSAMNAIRVSEKSTACRPCAKKQYSVDSRRDQCFNNTDEFLDWSMDFSIILSSFGVLGILISVVFAVLFMVNHSTPIVKALGGYLCFLELLSLLACFCLTFSFQGKPSRGSCRIGLPLFGTAFSVCMSCILANLLQILVGFNFNLKVGLWVKKLNRPVAVVVVVSGIQLALSLSWLLLNPSVPQEEILYHSTLHLCELRSVGFFAAMIAYNAILAFICFLFAFKCKQLPDLYKNATLISVSMLLFLIIWIVFVPIFLSMRGKYKASIESAAILISSSSILGCHLAPKCYIMVFRKESIMSRKAATQLNPNPTHTLGLYGWMGGLCWSKTEISKLWVGTKDSF
uniref:G-protein coupled receptor family C group 6 member A-like n=1 Tax=Gouania willdenowi TaxID=441366 RepID=A0A8C5DK18_GOUWI